MNEVLRQLASRKSVRVYTGEPVTAEEKQAILQAAFDAPTAGGQQLYTIIDVTDQPLKERLADLCDHQPFIAQAPLAELTDYSTRLRSITRGTGDFTMKPAGYEQVPYDVQAKLVERYEEGRAK